MTSKDVAELLRATREAADFLAELYAKYSTKVGPFASQAQRINGVLQRAMDAVQQGETTEPPVLGAGDGLLPMPTVKEGIEAHVRQIQMLCDTAGYDPTEWLSDNAAQGETGDRTQLHGALTRIVLEAQGCPPDCSHEFHTWAIRSILKIGKDALARVPDLKATAVIPSEAAGKALYNRSTANDPTIHCNRFPIWEELSHVDRAEWIRRAESEEVTRV